MKKIVFAIAVLGLIYAATRVFETSRSQVEGIRPLFVAGQTATYDVLYAMSGTYHGPLPGASRPLEARYDGIVTAAHVSSSDFRLTFTAERPWDALVALTPDGKITGLGFPPEVLPEQRALTRTLLSFLERPAPDEVTFTFDGADQPVRAVVGTRRVTHRMATRIVGEETSSFSMTLRGATPGQAQRPEVVARAQDLSGREDLVEARQNRLRERLDGASAETLETAVVASNDRSMKELQPLYLKLVALFTLDDEACTRFAGVLAKLPHPSSTFDAVATALATAGTPAAQAALRDAYSARTDENAKQILIPHLGNVRAPTDATQRFLEGLAQNEGVLGSTAVLALGSVAFNVRADDQRRAEGVTAVLAQKLKAAGDPRTRDLYLSALGNAGDRTQAQAILPFTKSDDRDLRLLAAHALRHVVSDDARSAVAALAADDPDERVRAGAVDALAGSDAVYAAVPFYEDLLQRETSIPVIKALLQNLARIVPHDPAARPALAAYAARAGHPDIAPYAKSLLGSWSAQSN